MRQVAIVQEYVPQYREPFFKQLGILLQKSDIQLSVFAGQPNGLQADRNDAVKADFIKHVAQREYAVAGKRLVVSNVTNLLKEFDLIIFEQARRNLPLYQILLKRAMAPRRRKRQILALWGHGRDYANVSGAFTSRLMTMLTHQADWFFGYTEDSVNHVVRGGYRRHRTTVVQNSIDTRSLIEQVDGFHAQSMRVSNVRRICYIGGLDESKKIAMLLRSADLMRSMEPNLCLSILGDGHLRANVENFCQTREWAEYLGHSSGAQKAYVLANSEILVNPGRVGLLALDSLATGVPIATTTYDYHAPEYGYLAPGFTCIELPDDEEAYARGVVAMLRQPQALGKMRANCISSRGQYSIEKMAGNFALGVIEALAETSATGSKS